jgi:hypothetical protein
VNQRLLASVLLSISLAAGIPPVFAGESKAELRSYFAGTNLFSPLPGMLPTPGNSLFSLLSNLECGLGLSGGMVVKECHALELRCAFGPNSREEAIFHSQAYYNFFPMQRFHLRMKGLYCGCGLRYWDLYNDLTDVHRNNVAGQADLGYRFKVWNPLYLDLRLSEIVAVYSWLSADHTVGGWATLFDRSLPRIPLLSVDVGVKL